jgi:hypothetical protein
MMHSRCCSRKAKRELRKGSKVRLNAGAREEMY